LLEPDSGQIEFRGIDLRALNTRELRILRRRIQLVEQDAASTIDPKWQVRKIVTEGLRLHEGCHRVDNSQIRYWLELLGLSLVILDRRGGELSIGEAQRIAIARALLLDPKLLALDEPGANLDRVARERLIDSVRAYHARTGGGVLLISHDAELVQALANEVIVLDQDGESLTPPRTTDGLISEAPKEYETRRE
jgi:ABC-type microcin C transport system duplicated ATPase subunit YejF